jgi:hypothetical protein
MGLTGVGRRQEEDVEEQAAVDSSLRFVGKRAVGAKEQ